MVVTAMGVANRADEAATDGIYPMVKSVMRQKLHICLGGMAIALAASLLCLALLARGTLSEADQPVVLFDVFHSGQTPEQVRRIVACAGLKWRVVYDWRKSFDDSRPPYHELTVDVDDYKGEYCRGDLRLHFFNGRLRMITFTPEDPEGFLQYLAAERGIDIPDGQDSVIQGSRKVWKGITGDGNPYVGWEDLELSEEMWQWIRRYS